MARPVLSVLRVSLYGWCYALTEKRYLKRKRDEKTTSKNLQRR